MVFECTVCTSVHAILDFITYSIIVKLYINCLYRTCPTCGFCIHIRVHQVPHSHLANLDIAYQPVPHHGAN